VRLGEDGEALPGTVVPLSRTELTLGSDPREAMVIVDDPSVSGLHARLVQEEEGKYRLFDAGSQAGTWVNFQPVLPEGVLLQHEDCIHLGRVMYRFDCTQPEKKREWHTQPVQGE
jgi:pSer/pThr/pTyr-binding forkhead associated (FHA) protein